jgi:DNA replication and repair protein RecF
MRITRLRLFRYRNIRELEIFPSPGTSLFSGNNGQGKTNLLESIYLLGYGKSFRSSNPKECIQHGEDECRVEGTIEHGSLRRELQITISKTEKKLYFLGKTVPLENFVGNLHLLAFTHEHLKVVRGAPLDRRAFLDRAMVALYPGHIGYLAAYGRALKQRNRFLTSVRDGKEKLNDNILDSWDEALIKAGSRILHNRLRYVEQMKEELPQGLFGGETLKMHYVSSAGTDDLNVAAIEENFRQSLGKGRAKDQTSGHTSVGPHRDELKLYADGKSLIHFGSAGQQRSGLLALYFSQMEIHRKAHGFYPVFLVDDAEAELDPQRLSTFMRHLAQRTQTFLTSSKGFLLTSLHEKSRNFTVSNGAVLPS